MLPTNTRRWLSFWYFLLFGYTLKGKSKACYSYPRFDRAWFFGIHAQCSGVSAWGDRLLHPHHVLLPRSRGWDDPVGGFVWLNDHKRNEHLSWSSSLRQMNPEGTSVSVCLARCPFVTPFVSRPGAWCSWFCHQYSRHPRGLRWTGVSCLVGCERFRHVSLDSFWTPSWDANFWRRHRGTVCASFSLEDFRLALRVFQSSLRVLLSCLTAYLWVWFQ